MSWSRVKATRYFGFNQRLSFCVTDRPSSPDAQLSTHIKSENPSKLNRSIVARLRYRASPKSCSLYEQTSIPEENGVPEDGRDEAAQSQKGS